MSILEELRNLDLKVSNPDDVRRLLTEYSILCVPFHIKKGVYVLRARKGGGFIKRSEMTYCPAIKCSTLQRATLAGQTMFYGVISDDQSHQERARCIAACECSTLCRDGDSSVGRETFTVAHWEVTKPLYVVSLITDNTFPDVHDNILLNQLREAYVLFHRNKKSTLDERTISQFISDEFSKVVKNNENYNYLISATVATDIVNDMGFDGIVFPSVQLGGQGGLNIAIKPHAVNNKLKFIGTLEQSLYKSEKTSFLRIKRATMKGITRQINQVPDSYIIRELGIKDLKNLPEY